MCIFLKEISIEVNIRIGLVHLWTMLNTGYDSGFDYRQLLLHT